MEYLAFKGLNTNDSGRLVSPSWRATWKRRGGVWQLKAKPGDLQRGAGIFAGRWGEANHYGTHKYLVVPYLPPFEGAHDADFVLAEDGWRSATASVVAGPIEGKRITEMPPETAEMIYAAWREGYRQVPRILLDAAHVLWPDGKTTEASAVRLALRAAQLEELNRMGVESFTEAAYRTVQIGQDLDPQDEIDQMVLAKARSLIDRLAENAYLCPEELAPVLGRLTTQGPLGIRLVLAVAKQSALRGSWDYPILIASQLSAALQEAMQAAQSGGALEQSLSEPVAQMGRDLGQFKLSAMQPLTEALAPVPSLLETFRREWALSHLKHGFAPQSAGQAEETLEDLLEVVKMRPELESERPDSIRSALFAAADAVSHSGQRTREKLRATLSGHPDWCAAFDRYVVVHALHVGPREIPTNALKRVVTVGQNYTELLHNDAELYSKWLVAAGEVGENAGDAMSCTLSHLVEIAQPYPELVPALEEGYASRVFDRIGWGHFGYTAFEEAETDLMAMAGVQRLRPELLRPGADLRTEALWAARASADRAYWWLEQTEERASLWDLVHHDPDLWALLLDLALDPSILSGFRGIPEPSALMHLVGLSRNAYSGGLLEWALAGAEETLPADEPCGLTAQERAALLGRACQVGDPGFVIAAGACWTDEADDALFALDSKDIPWDWPHRDFAARTLPLLAVWPARRISSYVTRLTVAAAQRGRDEHSSATIPGLARRVLAAWARRGITVSSAEFQPA